MKKNLLSVLCLVTLVGCGGVSTSSSQSNSTPNNNSPVSSSTNAPTSSSVKPSTPSTSSSSSVSDSNAVNNVLEKLSALPIAMSGNYQELMVQGEDEFEMSAFEVTSVLSDSYYYYATYNPFFGNDYQRIDKEADGRAKEVLLDPYTNEVKDYYLGDDYYGYYAFSDLFTNPFAKTNEYFEDGDGYISLVDHESFNWIFFRNILAGGGVFQDEAEFDSLKIGYDASYNPTTLDVVFYDRTWEEYGQVNKYVYSGSFVNPSDVDVSPLPEARPLKDEHASLKAMFDKIKEGNYTMHVTATENIENPEEWGDELPEPRSAISYVSKDGYYNEYVSGFWGQASDGKYMTDEGLVDFVVNEEGKVVEQKAAYSVRTVDTYFGSAWKYAIECYDVNDDGSFTLANEKGFYRDVWTNLLVDYNAVSVGIMDVGSLKLTVDAANNTLTYTYSCSDGYENYCTVISNIGSTSLPFTSDDVVKYVPLNNWSEYCAASTWNADWGKKLDFITNGHKDDVPFIDSPYNYQRSVQGESDYNWDTFPMEEIIISVHNISMVWECDTTSEMVDYAADIYAQLDAADGYRYDKYSDTYYYEANDSYFSLKISLSNGFMSMDGLFNRAIMMDIVNLK